MKKLLFILSFCLTGIFHAQTEIVFRYDEAGNQVYRGPYEALEDKTENLSEENSENFTIQDIISEKEKAFWREVTMAPVPVRDVLAITVSEEIQKNLQEISVYNMLGSLLYVNKKASASSRTEITMGHYMEGAYVVKFHLKGGEVYSQTILKHY